MYKLIKKIYFFLLIIIVLAGCSLGSIDTNTSTASTDSETKSNGQLQLKETEISLLAGESYQFQVSGGRRPYSFAGTLQSLINPASYI